MSPLDSLLQAILDRPDDEAQRLIVSDWLEDQPGEINRARAQLIRWQIERSRLTSPTDQQELDTQARDLMRQHRGLVSILQPLIPQMPVLTVPSLTLILTAPLASVMEGPLWPGSTWEGQLQQMIYHHPTILQIEYRANNLIKGTMRQDFTSMYAAAIHGVFYFRGVVVGRAKLVFVTYNTELAGIYPGLYDLNLVHGGWLTGKWNVPSYGISGTLTLRRLRQRS